MHPTISGAKLYLYTPFRHVFVARASGSYLYRFCRLIHSIIGCFGRQGLLIILYICFRLCKHFSIEKGIDGLNLAPLGLFQNSFLLCGTPQFLDMGDSEFDHPLCFGITVVLLQDCEILIDRWGNMTTIPM